MDNNLLQCGHTPKQHLIFAWIMPVAAVYREHNIPITEETLRRDWNRIRANMSLDDIYLTDFIREMLDLSGDSGRNFRNMLDQERRAEGSIGEDWHQARVIPVLDKTGAKVDEVEDADTVGIIVRAPFSPGRLHSPDFNHPEAKFYRFNGDPSNPAFVQCEVMTIMQ